MVDATTSPDEERDAHLFDELMAVAMTGVTHFGHRQHIHLTWLAVRKLGVPEATRIVSDGIRRTARYKNVPQKYHVTISRAWVELVGHHAARHPTDDFAVFADTVPHLLDKRLLSRHYRSATLADERARTGWVPPDLDPFPWQE